MNNKIEFLRNKGKLHDGSNFYSRASLEEIERAERNQDSFLFSQLDNMVERGEISLDNPPNIWAIDFGRWAVKRYGVKAYAESLKKGGFGDIAGRLRVLRVSESEIEAALTEPKVRTEKQAKSDEMKSKIMSLANRLAAKGQNRSAALVRAWAVVKAGGLELAVK